MLAARRKKRKALNGIVSEEKNAKVLAEFKRATGNMVNENLSKDKTLELVNRMGVEFNNDEQVQVSENFLDKKGKQELVELMNTLFEERAAALRTFMFELMQQKQRDLDDLRDEYEPQRQLLKQRHANGLLTDEDYKQKLEALNQEEHDKKMDIEIQYHEKETELKEDLERARIEAETEQKQLLKDRQHQEKMLMFKAIIGNMGDDNEMKNYLATQMAESQQEIEIYKKRAQKEQDKKINEMEADKERAMKELMERQERMFSWEDQVRKDEEKMMEQFKKQKEDMMAKKLAD